MLAKNEVEQLSLMIDELNTGRQPKCSDKNTAELLEIADLIRREHPPVPPPQHILDQTVNRALAGIQAEKRQKPRMWYFSALGSVAAAILVVLLNVLPSWQQQVSTLPLQIASSREQKTLPTSPDSNQPALTEKVQAIEPSGPANAAPRQTAYPPASSMPIEKAPAQTEPFPAGEQPKLPPTTTAPSLSKAPTSSDPTKIMAETAPQKKSLKSVFPAESMTKSVAPEILPLKLPGQTPDLVVADPNTGTERQVYFKGTPQELTIVQHLLPSDLGAQEDSTADNSDIHTVHVIIAGRDVTVSGRQSQQELLRIAKSLVP